MLRVATIEPGTAAWDALEELAARAEDLEAAMLAGEAAQRLGDRELARRAWVEADRIVPQVCHAALELGTAWRIARARVVPVRGAA